MAYQLLIDLHGCDSSMLDNVEEIGKIARGAVTSIGAKIVKECMHKFEPIGVSYIAVITTSHFSIHTWPEFGYAAIDIFSCNEEVPISLADMLAEAFGATDVQTKEVLRQIER